MISIQNRLLEWLRSAALPLWDAHGVDRRDGGYFENLHTDAERRISTAGDLRRGRVVARQIYVFDIGRRLGWRSRASDAVVHGCDYLLSRLYRGDGVFETALHGTSPDDPKAPPIPFSLYEQSFYLFALAHLHGTQAHRYPIAATAQRCLEYLRARYGRTLGGFEESIPTSLPLKSNPHMHLLEAALAWMGDDVSPTHEPARRMWIELARELVALCLTKFLDPTSGFIREYFDAEWRPMAGDAGRLLEPGHQFEWAWLLMRWARSDLEDSATRNACRSAAAGLVRVGEVRGVDRRRGVAVNELWDDLSVRDADAKLWPQTERVKAWCALLEYALTTEDPVNPDDAEKACRGIIAAAEGLTGYFRTDVPGLWYEVCSADGIFTAGACKASSLYHIVCAIDTLRDTLEPGRARAAPP